MSGNKRSQRFQRITVGVIALAIVVSLAMSLVSGAFAAPATSHRVERAAVGARQTGTTPTPAPVESSLHNGSTAKPHTKTPQGQATQVTDGEHIGGLVGFIAFMLGGVLLLIRGRHRERVRQS